MAKRKAKEPAAIPNAPVYLVGPRSIEWSYDGLSFHQCESFGEFASICFVGGRRGEK